MRGDDLGTPPMRLGPFSFPPFVKVFHAPENWWIIYPPPIPEFPGCCGRSSFASFFFPLFRLFGILFLSFFFLFFFLLLLLHNNNDRAAAPRGFFFFSFCLGLDGRRRAPKPCFISFRVKRKIRKHKTKKKKEKENHSVGYKPEEPSDYPATAHFVSQLKKERNREREKNEREALLWRHLITWSAHVLSSSCYPTLAKGGLLLRCCSSSGRRRTSALGI